MIYPLYLTSVRKSLARRKYLALDIVQELHVVRYNYREYINQYRQWWIIVKQIHTEQSENVVRISQKITRLHDSAHEDKRKPAVYCLLWPLNIGCKIILKSFGHISQKLAKIRNCKLKNSEYNFQIIKKCVLRNIILSNLIYSDVKCLSCLNVEELLYLDWNVREFCCCFCCCCCFVVVVVCIPRSESCYNL